jgi:hypothetical protein
LRSCSLRRLSGRGYRMIAIDTIGRYLQRKVIRGRFGGDTSEHGRRLASRQSKNSRVRNDILIGSVIYTMI